MTVKIKYMTMQYERPPKKRLFFDVILQNPQEEPRWFLLPDNLSPNQFQSLAVDTLNVYRLRGQGQVFVGHFSGSRGFQAMYLPGKADITLQYFPIPLRGELPPEVRIELITADELRIGDELAEDWFGMDPLSDREAVVTAGALANQREVIVAKHTPNREDVAVHLINEERINVKVSISD